MQFHMHVDLGSGTEGEQQTELEAILRRTRVKVTAETAPFQRDRDNPFKVYDSDGNAVGTAYFEEE